MCEHRIELPSSFITELKSEGFEYFLSWYSKETMQGLLTHPVSESIYISIYLPFQVDRNQGP